MQAKLDLGLKKYSREKVIDRLHVIWKGYKNSLISWINMKDIRLSQNFPELYEHSSGNVKVELDLSNYATKADLTVVTGIDTFMLASKTDLATMKTKVDDIDVDKLYIVPAALSKLSIVLDNNVVKKEIHIKVNAIDTEILSIIVSKMFCLF